MKNAVVVVGGHHTGKSRTINESLKPKLGIRKRQHKFRLKGQEGFILSQSLEEAGKCEFVAELVSEYSHFDLLVFAARPSNEAHSCSQKLIAKLKQNGYDVLEVNIEGSGNDFEGNAKKILRHLSKS
jgi:hypothetical protein